jgi:hypothetical protein
VRRQRLGGVFGWSTYNRLRKSNGEPLLIVHSYSFDSASKLFEVIQLADFIRVV